MDFSEGARLHGFSVVRSRYSSEVEGTLVELIHDRTGAQVCWLDNKAENKVFSIAFKTIPTDSTGVFHILEHSVLCGSEKYPVREPFVELIKSSMNTFLNALTFQDMTMYPVASRNDRDLLNLTSVYLDAVFAPNILRDPNIFRQEGWHIEKDENGEYIYKGVVFNEMKGAMSDVDQQMDRKMLQMLFPDTGYGHNSGGEPTDIPTLTYEQFLAAYRKHYHPSNARIWLDGDVPMDEMLSLIASYLDRFERSSEIVTLSTQKPFACEETIYFEIGQDEDAADKGRLSIGKIVGSWKDKVRNMAIGILGDVLTGSNEAPLKQAILSSGLAQDIALSIEGSIAQSYVSIDVDNITDGKEQEVLDTIRRVGQELCQTGIDRNALESTLNRFAFHLREEEEPQGLGRCIRAMNSWLYDGDPMFMLNVNDDIAELHAMMDRGDFNTLAEELLLNEENRAVLHAFPSFTVGEEKRIAEKEALKKITSVWTPEQVLANNEAIASLELWQKIPDSPEALATLPILKISDADQEPVWTETTVLQEDSVRILYHRIPCHGVVHLSLYFNLSDASLEDLTRLGMVDALLGRMPTANHDVLSLEQDIKKYTGRMDFSVSSRCKAGNADVCTMQLCVHMSALSENLPQALSLLAEILTTTRFDIKDKVNEIVMQCEMAARQRSVAAGHRIAMTDALSHFSADYAAKEALDGATYIRWLHKFAAEFDAEYPAFVTLLQRTLSRTVCKSRLTVGLTAQEEQDLHPLLNAIPVGEAAPEAASYSINSPYRRGYRIPAQIGFASRGFRLDRCGQEFSGSVWLTSNIISLSYLWSQVRVQGGAYGTGLQIDRNGNVFTYSYRDPTPARTLNVDAGFSAFLKEFAAGAEGLDKFIISALNDVNPLLSPRDKGHLADMRWLNGYTREDAEKLRLEILHTTMDDVLSCGEWLDRFAKEGSVCVVAHTAALEACTDLEIIDL